MSVIMRNDIEVGGTDDDVIAKVGTAELTTQADDLSGAVNELNSSLNDLSSSTTGTVTWNNSNVSGNADRCIWFKIGKLVIATLEFTPLSGKIVNNNVICTGLPIPNRSRRYMYGGNSQQMTLDVSNNEGVLTWYYPFDTTTLNRIDITIMYFTS